MYSQDSIAIETTGGDKRLSFPMYFFSKKDVKKLLFVAIFAMFSLSTSVSALCARVKPRFSPQRNTLPPNAVVYFLASKHDKVFTFSLRGGHIKSTQRHIAGDFQFYRVSLQATSKRITLTATRRKAIIIKKRRYTHKLSKTYDISAQPQKGARHSLTLQTFGTKQFRGSCSYTNARFVSLPSDGAIAYRIEWSPTR